MSTEQKHTPGPWHADSIDQLRTSKGIVIARCERKERHEYMDNQEQSANARRIALCVNALDGIPDETVMSYANTSPAITLKAQHKELISLRATNAELLAALKLLSEDCMSPSDGDAAKKPSREVLRTARAAIAKAEGQS